MNAPESGLFLDELDRQIVRATQAGLPLVAQPYHAVATQLAIPVEELMARMERMLVAGIIRRIGLVPNHYALGYTANGMSVWDVADDRAKALGEQVGRLPFVSHCYLRPRHFSVWPYNLFAMVHGHSREVVAAQVSAIAALLGSACHSHDVLYSSRILKKTGLRLSD